MSLSFNPETLPYLNRPIPGLKYLWVPSSVLDAHLEGGYDMTGTKSKPDGALEFYHLLKIGVPLAGLSDGSVASDVCVYIPDEDNPPAKAPEPKPRRSTLETLSDSKSVG